MSVIEATELRKSFRTNGGSVEVLRGVDVAIRPGEFITLLGPSGSGKSTLMHILGLMDKASSGTLTFAGTDVSTLNKGEMADIRRRELGFVFQTADMVESATVYENLEFPLIYAGVRGRERKENIEAALARVDLVHRSRHPANLLSGGERQRVAIARALVNRPRLILADEPTGQLDRANARRVLEVFKLVIRQGGATLIVVTHDPEVAGHCERVCRLENGVLYEP